mmetsp:Transcript_54829/g.169781  ORF Transcript_54829/g.169781 Transcript_54829/m.169781 type:complete len:243 (+) Transcript_54829:413-1141(+)
MSQLLASCAPGSSVQPAGMEPDSASRWKLKSPRTSRTSAAGNAAVRAPSSRALCASLTIGNAVRCTDATAMARGGPRPQSRFSAATTASRLFSGSATWSRLTSGTRESSTLPKEATHARPAHAASAATADTTYRSRTQASSVSLRRKHAVTSLSAMRSASTSRSSSRTREYRSSWRRTSGRAEHGEAGSLESNSTLSVATRSGRSSGVQAAAMEAGDHAPATNDHPAAAAVIAPASLPPSAP